jgi:copper chaperone CopZ
MIPMTQVFAIEGMHCGGCAARAQKAVTALAPGAVVTLDPPRLTLPDGVSMDAATINAALAKMGEWRATGPL